MAKSNLNNLIDWLASNPIHRFEIYDVDKEKTIQKCVSYEDLKKDFQTAIQYFEQLADNGIKTVQIVKKRKNGSSFVREGCGLNFALSTNDNVAASGSQAQPVATPQRSQNNIGLMGAANPFGLGLPEIMDMRSNADRYKETKQALDELKKEFKELQLENKKLENENLEHQLGIKNKPSAVDKLVEGIANNPSALPQIIASFKGGGSTPGLNAPEPQKPSLSDTKCMVVDMVSNPQIQDEHVAASYYVLIEAAKGNKKFMEEYSNLLTKYKLLENASNDTNNS